MNRDFTDDWRHQIREKVILVPQSATLSDMESGINRDLAYESLRDLTFRDDFIDTDRHIFL